MAEYINRERARFEAKRYFKNMGEIQEDLDMLFYMLPPEDVAPVRNGRWEKVAWWQHQNRYECNECSLCGCRVKPKFTYNYCPHCGAKMDLPAECTQEEGR